MATLYLDLEGGNDGNNGSSYALRFKTIDSGATAARIAPGDVIRCMASPNPVSLGVNATFTEGSATVTLASAVTKTIDNCESAWTASANVTATTTSTRKQGTNAAQLAIASGFTTGKAAYFDLGSSQDFSAYQAVSFWLRTNNGINAAVLQVKLCSDATGDTPVDTLDIPSVQITSRFFPIVIDKGSALGASIRSIAIYAASDPGTTTIIVDNFIACESPGATGALNHKSAIGKVHNLARQPSTAYTSGDIRRPPTGQRNGFRYECTTSGTSSASPITWPTKIGATVTDGTAVWTCEGLEETWWPVQSIDGTSVLLDVGASGDGNNATPASTNRGFGGDSGTVAAYARDVVWRYDYFISPIGLPTENGSVAGGQTTYSGGWNRTDMSTQDPDGETWWAVSQSYPPTHAGARSFLTWDGFGFTRADLADPGNGTRGNRYLNCHFLCNGGSPTYLASTNNAHSHYQGCCFAANFCSQGGLRIADLCSISFLECSWLSPFSGDGIYIGNSLQGYMGKYRLRNLVSRNSSDYGLEVGGPYPVVIDGSLLTAGNATGGINVQGADVTVVRPELREATKTNFYTSNLIGQRLVLHEYERTADDHRHLFPSAEIKTATDQRNTASGRSWKFSPGSTSYDRAYPLTLPLARVAVAAGSQVDVSIYVRRDSTNIKGRLYLVGGSVSGDDAVEVACEPSVNTWTQYTMSFTPAEAGVIEVAFDAHDGQGTTNNLWIDDLAVAQA